MVTDGRTMAPSRISRSRMPYRSFSLLLDPKVRQREADSRSPSPPTSCKGPGRRCVRPRRSGSFELRRRESPWPPAPSLCSCCRMPAGEDDARQGALSWLALEHNRSGERRHDTVADGETEAGAPTDGLGREEGIED